MIYYLFFSIGSCFTNPAIVKLCIRPTSSSGSLPSFSFQITVMPVSELVLVDSELVRTTAVFSMSMEGSLQQSSGSCMQLWSLGAPGCRDGSCLSVTFSSIKAETTAAVFSMSSLGLVSASGSGRQGVKCTEEFSLVFSWTPKSCRVVGSVWTRWDPDLIQRVKKKESELRDLQQPLYFYNNKNNDKNICIQIKYFLPKTKYGALYLERREIF